MKRNARPRGKYLAALQEYTATESCVPVEDVVHHPLVKDIASRFGKTSDQVSHDINRIYLDSYRMPRSRNLRLVPDHW